MTSLRVSGAPGKPHFMAVSWNKHSSTDRNNVTTLQWRALCIDHVGISIQKHQASRRILRNPFYLWYQYTIHMISIFLTCIYYTFWDFSKCNIPWTIYYKACSCAFGINFLKLNSFSSNKNRSYSAWYVLSRDMSIQIGYTIHVLYVDNMLLLPLDITVTPNCGNWSLVHNNHECKLGSTFG